MLDDTMRDFQRSLRANADRLLHARDLVEAVVQTIGQSLGAAPASAHRYGGPAQADRQVGEGHSRRVRPALLGVRRCR